MSDEWEQFGREAGTLYLQYRRTNLQNATRDLETLLRNGEEITEHDIRRFRHALAGLQEFVENDLTTVAEDEVEPYDGSIDHIREQVFAEHRGDPLEDK